MITVKVSTKGYGGRTITESVSIQTNDTKQPNLKVTVRGPVEKLAEITPSRAILTGPEGKPLSVQISITPKDKFPFKIVNIRARKGNFIKYGLEEIKESGKSSYILTVENTKPDKGRYSDVIYLDTDNKSFPPVHVYVVGNIQEK